MNRSKRCENCKWFRDFRGDIYCYTTQETTSKTDSCDDWVKRTEDDYVDWMTERMLHADGADRRLKSRSGK